MNPRRAVSLHGMRKLIVSNIISLDGYFEGPGKDVMALPMDETFDAHNAERLQAADTLLFGRRTYQLFEGYWPAVLDQSTASPDQLQIARKNQAIEKVVVSDTLRPEQSGPWRDTTRIVRRADAHAHLAALKAGRGGDILMFGSGILWNDLLRAGLVDELYVTVGAAALGGGTPLFEQPARGLRLLGMKRREGSDNVVLRYAVG